ncbi:unnamed protein product, partial [Polarella glacialis]
ENESIWTVDRSTLLGWRAVAPTYTVPIIPYLQTEKGELFTPEDMPDMPQEEVPSQPEEGKVAGASVLKDDEPYVLMPDVVFQLRSKYTNHDHGSTSLHLPISFAGNILDQEARENIEKGKFIFRVLQNFTPREEDLPTYMKLSADDRIELMHRTEGWSYGRKVLDASDVNSSGHIGMATMMEQLGTINPEGWFPSWALENDVDVSWAEKSAQEYSRLETELKKVTKLHASVDEDAYEVYIDVFAARDGYLQWDDNFQIGRSLMSQHLFTIKDKDKDKPRKPLEQFFNAADWMQGREDVTDETFDWRVTPALRCAELEKVDKTEIWRWNHTRPDKGDAQEKSFLHGEVLGTKHEGPLKMKDFFANFQRAIFPVIPFSEKEMEGKRTEVLVKLCKQYNFRCMSHVHVPERLPNKTFTFGQEWNTTEDDFKHHLHTFVVA